MLAEREQEVQLLREELDGLRKQQERDAARQALGAIRARSEQQRRLDGNLQRHRRQLEELQAATRSAQDEEQRIAAEAKRSLAALKQTETSRRHVEQECGRLEAILQELAQSGAEADSAAILRRQATLERSLEFRTEHVELEAQVEGLQRQLAASAEDPQQQQEQQQQQQRQEEEEEQQLTALLPKSEEERRRAEEEEEEEEEERQQQRQQQQQQQQQPQHLIFSSAESAPQLLGPERWSLRLRRLRSEEENEAAREERLRRLQRITLHQLAGTSSCRWNWRSSAAVKPERQREKLERARRDFEAERALETERQHREALARRLAADEARGLQQVSAEAGAAHRLEAECERLWLSLEAQRAVAWEGASNPQANLLEGQLEAVLSRAADLRSEEAQLRAELQGATEREQLVSVSLSE
ncbi:unnamed protein product [Polarella glacialis]|uniref:Uncharacterized protein n=1 Tax=Polarella glacialis TaxID=89957 RepID=A0A813END1_POLGL|nr:unnamed protein product [Polarella glacialis]